MKGFIDTTKGGIKQIIIFHQEREHYVLFVIDNVDSEQIFYLNTLTLLVFITQSVYFICIQHVIDVHENLDKGKFDYEQFRTNQYSKLTLSRLQYIL